MTRGRGKRRGRKGGGEEVEDGIRWLRAVIGAGVDCWDPLHIFYIHIQKLEWGNQSSI